MFFMFVLATLHGVAAPASREPIPAEPAASAANPDAATVQIDMWIVSFDPTIDRTKLPFDVKSRADWIARSGVRPRPDGRISTLGLAIQEKAAAFVIECAGYALRMKSGVLVSEATSNTGRAGKAPWEIVAAPKVRARMGQKASIALGAAIPFMTRRDDGCLVVEKSDDLVEGAVVELSVDAERSDGLRFDKIAVKVSRLAGRQPIPGVPFDVGRPIVESRETSLGLTLAADKVAMIPLPQNDEDPPITLFMTARLVEGAR